VNKTPYETFPMIDECDFAIALGDSIANNIQSNEVLAR
jgi:hypothetical protein